MSTTNQGQKQQSFRTIAGSTEDYNGDFLSAADTESIIDLSNPADSDNFNGALLEFLQNRLSSSSTNINQLKQEYADSQGVYNWDSVTNIPVV